MTTSLDHISGNEFPANYFSGEFENFLHGLGSMVYKYKNRARQASYPQYFIQEDPSTSSTEPNRLHRKNIEKLHRTQKEVLKDVLMMKLVSYYENKYKLQQTEQPDTGMSTTITSLSPVLTNNMTSYKAYKQLPGSETYSYNVKPSSQYIKQYRDNNRQRSPNDIAEIEVL